MREKKNKTKKDEVNKRSFRRRANRFFCLLFEPFVGPLPANRCRSNRTRWRTLPPQRFRRRLHRRTMI